MLIGCFRDVKTNKVVLEPISSKKSLGLVLRAVKLGTLIKSSSSDKVIWYTDASKKGDLTKTLGR